MAEDFTLSALAEIAGMPKRAVQLWADAGVIKANPATMLAGSGVHRRFKRDEVIIACIVTPFAKQKMAIGGLKNVASGVRGYLHSWRQNPSGHPFIDFFEGAATRQHNGYLMVSWAEGKNGELIIEKFKVGFDVVAGELFSPREADSKPIVKTDVIHLNEALQDLPAKP
jgi:hypothetical protein